MTNQKECKEVRMESWLPKLLSRDMKTKTINKLHRTKILKNNGNVKAMVNTTPTMDHNPKNG